MAKLYISNVTKLTLIGHANMTSPSGIPKTTSRIIYMVMSFQTQNEQGFC